MQKRSHKLLARTLLNGCDGFDKKRYEKAFLFGSFEPDCNFLSYFKGSIRGKFLMGHNFSNSQRYISRSICSLQRHGRWSIWQYYTLGKLTHYLADAFTFPHNDTYPDSIAAHHRYEAALRVQFSRYLSESALRREQFRRDPAEAIGRLHRQYLSTGSDWSRDSRYIMAATGMLMASLLPQEIAAV